RGWDQFSGALTSFRRDDGGPVCPGAPGGRQERGSVSTSGEGSAVSTWIMEPGHTEAEFRARHMMVTWVRGLFKDIHGQLDFEWDRPLEATFEGVIDVRKIWTGEPTRDAHLRSADFFDVEHYPTITFSGGCAERTGDMS